MSPRRGRMDVRSSGTYISMRWDLAVRLGLALLVLASCGARTGLPVSDAADAASVAPAEPPTFDARPAGPEFDAGCGDCAIAFASGPEWASNAGSVDADGGLSPVRGASTGPARDVCVTAANPPNCGPGALIYGRSDTPWLGGRTIPSAHWIWRGDVTLTGAADLQVATFEQTFNLGADPTGTIQLSVDDRADVFVNGIWVGTAGSVTDFATAANGENLLVEMDLTPALQVGPNVVIVVAENGPITFGSGCADACNYAENPAGVVFAGTLRWRQ